MTYCPHCRHILRIIEMEEGICKECKLEREGHRDDTLANSSGGRSGGLPTGDSVVDTPLPRAED